MSGMQGKRIMAASSDTVMFQLGGEAPNEHTLEVEVVDGVLVVSPVATTTKRLEVATDLFGERATLRLG